MGIWSQASSLAEQTPAARNRYVDFLRAASILFVITGHWLIATAHYVDGALTPGDLLDIQPWTRWLTWLFQVMPIFFIVGGYANAVSLESARRKGQAYNEWLVTRLNRLVTPVLVLIVIWAGLAMAMRLFGVRDIIIQFASQAALIPIWFLAIYIMVVILAPLTERAWKRWGYGSLVFFAAVAVFVDYLYFAQAVRWLGWSNYFWVWLAVHQLGYAWRDDRIGRPLVLLGLAGFSAAALMLMIFKGPYPLAMAGSPGEGVSNTLPPKVTLLALGLLQFGVLLAIETPMRRLLENLRWWTATVLINSMIMTIYLWHVTVMIVVVAVAFLLDGAGMHSDPGSSAWWWQRIPWLLVLYGVLLPVALVIAPLERRPAPARAPSAVRQIIGAAFLCLGIALLARYGYGGGPWARFDLVSFGLVVVGAGLSGILPLPGASTTAKTSAK